jgi:hypothetical protein
MLHQPAPWLLRHLATLTDCLELQHVHAATQAHHRRIKKNAAVTPPTSLFSGSSW